MGSKPMAAGALGARFASLALWVSRGAKKSAVVRCLCMGGALI